MEKWSKLQLASGPYIIKFDSATGENDETKYTFWVSDFKTLWTEAIATKEDLLKRISDHNPAIVEPNDDWLGRLITLFGKPQANVQQNTEIMANGDLQLKYLIDDDILKFQWLLTQCDPQMFFDQITKSMLHQIGELFNAKKQLIEIVKKKDDEIRQYKVEGAPELQRTKFITEPFEESQLTTQAKMFDCEIGEFENIIGRLSSSNVVPSSPLKNIHKSPSTKKGRHRKCQYFKQIVKLGVQSYETTDDEDNPTQSDFTLSKAKESEKSRETSVAEPKKKRIRLNIDL